MKIIYLAFFMFFIGCNTIPGEKEVTNNIKATLQYFEYFNENDWDKLAQIHTPNAEFVDRSKQRGVFVQSRKQFKEEYESFNGRFFNLKKEVIHMYPSGDKNIIAEYTYTGSAIDGSPFSSRRCTIFTFENNLISKEYTY